MLMSSDNSARHKHTMYLLSSDIACRVACCRFPVDDVVSRVLMAGQMGPLDRRQERSKIGLPQEEVGCDGTFVG